VLRCDPESLPPEARASDGLFELAPPVARRALDIGVLAREPSFHVFVAADPEMMVEDDVVRYVQRVFAAGTGRPLLDSVYVHDFAYPEAPRPLLFPAGVGGEFAETMDAFIAHLREVMPAITEGDELKAAQDRLASELEAHSKSVLSELETAAKSLGFGVRNVKGGMHTFPMLHGKPLSAEQFAVLDESTRRGLNEAEELFT